MDITKLKYRFDELFGSAGQIESTRKVERSQYGVNLDRIDSTSFITWIVRAENLLKETCGDKSSHYLRFSTEFNNGSLSDYQKLLRARAVFLAAYQHLIGGHLISIRNVIRADVFASEIEQARELFSMNMIAAAAVIARVVLETHLRHLCEQYEVPICKLDLMNVALEKVGAYNKVSKMEIIAKAAVGNSAAHGNIMEYTKSQVDGLIEFVVSFISAYPSK